MLRKPANARRLRDDAGGHELFRRWLVRSWARLLGNLLLVGGVVGFGYAAFLYFGELSDRALPRPVALTPYGGGGEKSYFSSEAESPSTVPSETRKPGSGDIGGVSPATAPADSAEDAPAAARTPTGAAIAVRPGIPVRMAIPSIGLDSAVREAGIYRVGGELYWETLPHVVAHYRSTAEAGARGNAVFSGHVASRDAGNVFKELYRIRPGDEVELYTEDSRFIYIVNGLRLVLPGDVSVMKPTSEATATLITCAGEWNPAERSYSHRLVVTAQLAKGEELP